MTACCRGGEREEEKPDREAGKDLSDESEWACTVGRGFYKNKERAESLSK